MILVIDNYDSFTWNLVHRLWEIDTGLDIRVVRNDAITPGEAEALGPSHVIISPGPCTPAEAGASGRVLERMAGRAAVLGVCLGHQCMGQNLGLRVDRHPKLMHGKTSDVAHDGRGVYDGLDPATPITVTRYHSLVVREPEDGLPDGWAVSAWVDEEIEPGRTERVIMGLRREWDGPMYEGVQFHPESFLTEEGPRLLENYLRAKPTTIGSTHTGRLSP